MQLTADPESFPPSPPRDTNDPSCVSAHEWAAFGQVREMTDHWDRPSWIPGTRAHYWLLVLPPDAALVSQAVTCQQEVAHLEFDAIAPDGLHLTLGRIALAGTVTAADLKRTATKALRQIPPAHTLRAIPMTASRGAIRYSIAPWTPYLALHHHLSSVQQSLGLPPLAPTAHQRPHLGIAYANRRMPADAVRTALLRLRDLPSVDIAIDRVQLVTMRREPGAYRWDVEHEVALSDEPAPATADLHAEP